MFYLLLGINALTDWREGFVYDGLSLLLFLYCLIHSLIHGIGPWFPLVLLMLAILGMADRAEIYLGRGDYLIILSVSLYSFDFPMVLILTAGSAMVGIFISKRRRLPLVPFLFMGCLMKHLIFLVE